MPMVWSAICKIITWAKVNSICHMSILLLCHQWRVRNLPIQKRQEGNEVNIKSSSLLLCIIASQPFYPILHVS